VKSYGQYCALAKALDVVGGRWTLLIVRELLIRGRLRYTDLREGLPGIATNLLVDRLRELEKFGIVESAIVGPPISANLFWLTERGAALEPILMQLGAWGAPLLAEASSKDKFHTHWIALPAKLHLVDLTPSEPSVCIQLEHAGEPLSIRIKGTIQPQVGPAADADLTLKGRPRLLLGTLLKRIDWNAAIAAGLKYEGDPAVLSRIGRAGSANGRSSVRGISPASNVN